MPRYKASTWMSGELLYRKHELPWSEGLSRVEETLAENFQKDVMEHLGELNQDSIYVKEVSTLYNGDGLVQVRGTYTSIINTENEQLAASFLRDRLRSDFINLNLLYYGEESQVKVERLPEKEIHVEETELKEPYFAPSNDAAGNTAFRAMVHDIFQSIHDRDSAELKRLYSWEECELDYEFPGFLYVYADLKDRVPKDFTVIDFGCNQAVQGDYFKDHTAYIGIDCNVPAKWRLRQDNARYYECSIQQFIQEILPELGLDPNKTFAVCSYVPDNEARKMVRDSFPFHRDYYVGCPLSERIPDEQRTKEKPHKNDYER